MVRRSTANADQNDARSRAPAVSSLVEELQTPTDTGETPFRPLSPEQAVMIEWSPNPKLVLDGQFRIRFVNRATMAYGKVDRDALIGRNVWECYPALRGSIFEQAYRRVLETGEPARFERHELETDRWQSVYAFPAEGGVVAVLEDVTEQRRNMERLRQSEETLRLAQESANIGSFYRDLRTGESFWSEQLIRICGLDPSTFDQLRIGQDPRLDFVHPHDAARVRDAWKTTILTGEPQQVRNRVIRHDGTIRHLLSSTMLVRDENGEPARIVGTSLDVTAQVAAEEERQRIDAQMQQAQKLESLGVLAGGIAHDFNNLLVGILGNASLAVLEVGDQPVVQECLAEIEQSAQRAAELTRQLLAYAGKGRYVIERANATRVIHDMSALLRSAISRSAVLDLDLSTDLPAIAVDTNQFRQVVMTVVTNGSDALGERPGTIRVTTGSQSVTAEYLTACVAGTSAAPGRYVFVEVRDTGSGMDEATRTRMFEPFFSTKFTGRGLGLAAAIGIMRAHKGAIRVYSELGSGTSVKLLFPAATEPEHVEPAALPPVFGRGEEILLVDDEASVRGVAASLLRRRGFTVTEAADGEEGIERFREAPSRYSLVLLDFTMPRMTGDAAARAIRAIRPDIKVVMMSGYSEKDVKRELDDIAGFVQKPFSASELYREVLKHLPD